MATTAQPGCSQAPPAPGSISPRRQPPAGCTSKPCPTCRGPTNCACCCTRAAARSSFTPASTPTIRSAFSRAATGARSSIAFCRRRGRRRSACSGEVDAGSPTRTCARSGASLRLGAGELDHFPPARDLARQIAVVDLRRAGYLLAAEVGYPRPDLRIGERRIDRDVELVDDLARRAG